MCRSLRANVEMVMSADQKVSSVQCPTQKPSEVKGIPCRRPPIWKTLEVEVVQYKSLDVVKISSRNPFLLM